jgi:hypothetical protein
MDANLPEILVGIDGPGDDLIDHLPKAMRRASLSAEEIEELLRFNDRNRERHRRYVLIDEISGHVWGDVVAANPIKACRAIDARCGQHKRKKIYGHQQRAIRWSSRLPTGPGRPAIVFGGVSLRER